MAVWLLEYRVFHPCGIIHFQDAYVAHDIGNAWLKALRAPPSGADIGFESQLQPEGAASRRFDPFAVSRNWLGYFMLFAPEELDGGAIARRLCDLVYQECTRRGWRWQGEVRTPSEVELLPLVQQYPKAERWALLELFSSVYQPPWRRAEPPTAPDGGGPPCSGS